MNNEQEKIIEIHVIVNMHETNPKDTYFVITNGFNAILVSHLQMPGG